MSRTWTLELDVDSVRGKGRPRLTKAGRAYTPKSTKDAERAISKAWREAHGARCLVPTGKVAVELYVYRRLPASKPKGLLAEPDTHKPDADNVLKLVLDALNGLAYADDSQVTWVLVSKADRTRRDREHLSIKVEQL